MLWINQLTFVRVLLFIHPVYVESILHEDLQPLLILHITVIGTLILCRKFSFIIHGKQFWLITSIIHSSNKTLKSSIKYSQTMTKYFLIQSYISTTECNPYRSSSNCLAVKLNHMQTSMDGFMLNFIQRQQHKLLISLTRKGYMLSVRMIPF